VQPNLEMNFNSTLLFVFGKSVGRGFLLVQAFLLLRNFDCRNSGEMRKLNWQAVTRISKIYGMENPGRCPPPVDLRADVEMSLSLFEPGGGAEKLAVLNA